MFITAVTIIVGVLIFAAVVTIGVTHSHRRQRAQIKTQRTDEGRMAEDRKTLARVGALGWPV